MSLKILIVTGYKGSWPYIPELVAHLTSKGVSVDILDIEEPALIGSDGKRVLLFEGFLKSFFSVRIMGHFLRIFVLKQFLRSLRGKYDVVNIHFALEFYNYLVCDLGKAARSLAVTIWGSDFYRVPSKIRDRMMRLYDAADAITFINPQTRNDFIDSYHKYEEKAYILRFGLGSLEIIRKIRSEESIGFAKERLKLPADAFVIVCGYNANRAQQHDKLISLLSSMHDQLPENTIVLFPMTYPQDMQYVSDLEDILKKSPFKFRIFSEMMSDEDTARLRSISDLVLNIQTTDQLSASIQEHLFAGSIVIAGRWLPYDILDEMGVAFFRVADLDKMKAAVAHSVRNMQDLKAKCSLNADIIYPFASWNCNTGKWIELYGKLAGKELDWRSDCI